MDKERYEQIQKIMQDETLREDLQRSHPELVAAMAGYLLHPWLPVDDLRRVLMFAFIVAGVMLGMFLHALYLLLLVGGAAFSPRIVGEAAHFLGRFFGNKH